MARPARLTVVADTGAIFALVDASDSWHERVLAWWGTRARDVVLPVTILPEISYLLGTRISPFAEAAFAKALADGEFVVEPLETVDLIRAAELVRQYSSLPLGFTDATVLAVAERLNAVEILTTDRRHFSAARTAHKAAIAP